MANNAIGVELAQREFPGYEAVMATHIDADHIHNHIVVNSVSFETGKKLMRKWLAMGHKIDDIPMTVSM